MENTMGFVTIATGDAHYYHIADNLRRSYQYFTDNPLPFAILCDRENQITQRFDKAIVMRHPTCSYLDKLQLFDYLPYDTTIFIDADCLAYGNLNQLFSWFASADDFSCMGRVLPLEDKTGWFNYEDLGDLQEQVSYCVGLHGGIYYIRRSKLAAAVFETAKQIAEDYHRFHFKGNFSSPGDEPILALSMALNRCRPVPHNLGLICCYWEWERSLSLAIHKGTARIRPEKKETILVHWGTRFTHGLVYRKQIAGLDHLLGETGTISHLLTGFKIDLLLAAASLRGLLLRIFRKCKRLLHLS